MATYYETKIRYGKMMQDGMVKNVNELYLVDAISFTEAETRITEESSVFNNGDLSVVAIKRTPIAEIFNPEAEKFFLAKVGFITINEKSGAEKKTISQILVGGMDYDDAKGNFETGMKNTLSDWELVSLSETAYIDVILNRRNEV